MMWLTRTNGLSRKKIEILLDYFSSPREVWYAPKEILMKINGIGSGTVELICNSKNEEQFEDWIYELEEKNIQYISIQNHNYPSLLKEIIDPPFGFYLRGDMPDEEIEKVSIVGARRCSEYGRTCGFKIAKQLSQCNIAVVSGMATGIDTSAHLGAIDGSGPTIAVLGCGVDVCFPSENRLLMDKISKSGCIISEYPPGTPPLAHHFPMRNRIICGLSKITIVIEAAKRSGSLITAELAMDSGREVFAVPGNVTNALSEGVNNLIKDGAYPITNINDIEDVLFVLGIKYTESKKIGYIKKNISMLATDEKRVYDCINLEPVSIDTLLDKIEISIRDIQYILSMLEIKGYIVKLAGQRYIKAL